MKFFIDTAEVKELGAVAAMGCVDGVTTPSASRPPDATLLALCAIAEVPVSVVCSSTTAVDLIAEARRLATLHPNVVAAIPMGVEGLEAVKALASEGLRTNVTRCFTANQALLCMKAGATWVSLDGLGALRDTVSIFRTFGAKTQVLVAGLRDPEQVLQSALLGADAVSLPGRAIDQLATSEKGASWS